MIQLYIMVGSYIDQNEFLVGFHLGKEISEKEENDYNVTLAFGIGFISIGILYNIYREI